VALENIDTWRSRAKDGKEAAANAIREVWGALLASTATTAAVFIPIVLWEGEVGELLRDVAYAVSFSVILSFFVAVLAIPSLAARLVKPRSPPIGSAGGPDSTVASQKHAGRSAREGLLRGVSWLIQKPLRSVLVVGAGVTLTSYLAFAFLPKMEYLPTGNRNLLFGIVLPPPGISVDELMQTGFETQAVMMKHTGKSVDDVPAVERSFFVGDPSQLFIGAVAENPDQVVPLRGYMTALHARIPGTIGFVSQAALFSRGIGEGRAVELQLSGNDLSELVNTGRSLFGALMQAVPGSRVRPIPVLDAGAPEWHLIPEQEQLALSGFDGRDLSLIADAYVDGAIIGEYGREGEHKLDLLLKSNESWAPGGDIDESALAAAPVAIPSGQVVPFGVLSRIETRLGPTSIQRIERKRSVTLQLTPPDDVPFEEAIDRVNALVAQMKDKNEVPASVELSLGGSAGKLVEAQAQFAWILVVALIISFFLLAGLFEDFMAPVVVLVVLPLAAAGGVLALSWVNKWITPQPLDLMTALGFLILIGVVVNNAILIVDGALARLRDGVPLVDATVDAVRGRVRPIFMSTLTSLAGLMPMVMTRGAGGELYRGVGTIVLGGLALSTVLSLFVVPALFTLLWQLRARGAAVQ
jgi:HAE1 family hydrophobic/amphiphilic exporter-1